MDVSGSLFQCIMGEEIQHVLSTLNKLAVHVYITLLCYSTIQINLDTDTA